VATGTFRIRRGVSGTTTTAYRFRVKFAPDPRSLWRDIVVGGDRTVDGVQTTNNATMGLDQGHLWLFGTDEDYWNSDVTYQCPQQFENEPTPSVLGFDEEIHDAAETTVDDLVDRLDLAERDRVCYLYDYGDEWRFYAIPKEADSGASGDRAPEVVDAKGDPVEQYPPADEGV